MLIIELVFIYVHHNCFNALCTVTVHTLIAFYYWTEYILYRIYVLYDK